jgi:predicted Rossmann fold flavoprotein
LQHQYHIIIIGGGAAGFFTAINIKEKNPSLSVAIMEKSEKVLSKVRISGGGRCNVTNNCPDVQLFLKHYPRGEKELRGPFQRFGNKETVQWFEQRGVPLKAQDDGRFFPVSNQSESIIQCFLDKALQLNIPIFTRQSVYGFS